MFDPKFEYNGKLFDVETLQAAADDKGMSYEDFLAEMKAKGLKEINQEPTFVQTTTEEEQQKLSEYQQATQLSADQQKEIDDLYGTEDNPNLDIFTVQKPLDISQTGGLKSLGLNILINQMRKNEYTPMVKTKIEEIKEKEQRVIDNNEAQLLVLKDLRNKKKADLIGGNEVDYINKNFKGKKEGQIVLGRGGPIKTQVEEYDKEAQEEYFKIAQKNQKDYTDYLDTQGEYLDNLKADIDTTQAELEKIDSDIKNIQIFSMLTKKSFLVML